MEFPGEKLVCSMWDSLVNKGIGGLLRPWQMLREGKAQTEVRRNEMLALAQTERDVAEIRSGQKCLADFTQTDTSTGESSAHTFHLPATWQRAGNDALGRMAVKQLEEDIHVAKAITYAEQELLTSEDEATERKVEDDWLERWREYAAQVSAEHMQQLWGTVLAGEVKRPGGISLRTMDFLRSLSKDEAASIEAAAPFVLSGIIPLVLDGMDFKPTGQLDVSYLQELGIIVPGKFRQISLESVEEDKYLSGLIGTSYLIVVSGPGPRGKIPLDAYEATKLGREIFGFLAVPTDYEHAKAVCHIIARYGASPALGKYKKTSNGDLVFTDAVETFGKLGPEFSRFPGR